jgi:hypothetical protein
MRLMKAKKDFNESKLNFCFKGYKKVKKSETGFETLE